MSPFQTIARASVAGLREAVDSGRASEAFEAAHTLAVAAAEAEEFRIHAAARAIEGLAFDGTVVGVEVHLATIVKELGDGAAGPL